VTSGIRIGAAAITTRGFTPVLCKKVVECIDAIVNHVENEELIVSTRKEVNMFMEQFPLYEHS
jgi:glycine hydroxymethyltransferase